jgi:hypothetical protein
VSVRTVLVPVNEGMFVRTLLCQPMKFCFRQPMRYCFYQNSSGPDQWCSVPSWTVRVPTNEVMFPSELFWCHDFFSSVLLWHRPMRFCFLRTVLAQTCEVLFRLELFMRQPMRFISIRTVLVPTNEILFPLGLFWCRPMRFSEILFSLGLFWCRPMRSLKNCLLQFAILWRRTRTKQQRYSTYVY